MDEVSEIVSRIEALAKKLDRSPATLSRKVLGNGTRLDALKAGGGVNIKMLPRIQERLAEMEREAA